MSMDISGVSPWSPPRPVRTPAPLAPLRQESCLRRRQGDGGGRPFLSSPASSFCVNVPPLGRHAGYVPMFTTRTTSIRRPEHYFLLCWLSSPVPSTGSPDASVSGCCVDPRLSFGGSFCPGCCGGRFFPFAMGFSCTNEAPLWRVSADGYVRIP